MKFERITLYNFRQYYDRQHIRFSVDPARPVTVIHGINGAGKTSMFTAINWCLYGKQVIDSIGELVSKEALSQTQPGELIETWVELAFSHDGLKYVMRRSMATVRQVDGQIQTYDNDQLSMRRITADGQAEKENSPLITINAILPANVRTYFLFNGEKIDEFAKPQAASEVKDAIYLVLRLEVMDRARKHLRELAKDYRKELVQISGNEELAKWEREIRKREEEQQQTQQRLEEIDRELINARTRVAEIDQLLSSMQEVRSLHEERKQTEEQLKRSRRTLEQLIADIQANASQAYLAIGRPILTRALEILDDKRVKGQIPSNIRRPLVQDLLHKLTCICGRPFTEGSPEYETLKSLLLDTVSSSLEKEVLDTNTSLHSLLVQGDNKAYERHRFLQQRIERIEEITALEGRLSDLEQQLKGSSFEDARKLEKQRQDFRADIESSRFEQGQHKERLDTIMQEIESLTEKIQKAQKESTRAQHLDRKFQLAQKSAQAIDDTYEHFANEMRLQIEQRTNEIFRSMIWKDSHFERVTLGTDYNLEIVDRYGMSARPELSAGERQVLSLSFIAAMSQVSGEEAPLVMDTPFGRLSSYHRDSITSHLPRLSSQMILFVTDEELRDDARRNLEPYLGIEYRLNFDKRTSCTTIEEI